MNTTTADRPPLYQRVQPPHADPQQQLSPRPTAPRQPLTLQPRTAPPSWLGGRHLPDGIKTQFLHSDDAFARRYWIVDNSGSMATTDGHRIVANPSPRFVSSSRWAELGDALRFHAETAVSLRAPTEFRLLNPPVGTPQLVVCGDDAVAAPTVQLGTVHAFADRTPAHRHELAAAFALADSAPTGRTPLCGQIREVVAQVRRDAGLLRAGGKRVVVVIASDGAATDGDVAEALRPLRELPVWLVVRLCTDDVAVVNYWNSIDEDLELEMDVLDDLEAEAKEVKGLNPWLTYGAPLQRLREWGTAAKVFDRIDEKALAAPELQELCTLILGPTAADLPPPDADWRAFQDALESIMAKQPPVWDPTRKKHRPWFSASKLRKAFKGGACTVM